MAPLYSLKDFPKLLGLIGIYLLLGKSVVVVFASNDIVDFSWLTLGIALPVLLVGGYKFLPAA